MPPPTTTGEYVVIYSIIQSLLPDYTHVTCVKRVKLTADVSTIININITTYSIYKHHKSPPTTPLHPWERPESPWSMIHMDYAGPFLGEMFLLIVDAHSKWMDIYSVKSAASQDTIKKLQQSFSVIGLPNILVSDNGTCFTSAEFETFMKQNGIDHVRSAPFCQDFCSVIESHCM